MGFLHNLFNKTPKDVPPLSDEERVQAKKSSLNTIAMNSTWRAKVKNSVNIVLAKNKKPSGEKNLLLIGK